MSRFVFFTGLILFICRSDLDGAEKATGDSGFQRRLAVANDIGFIAVNVLQGQADAAPVEEQTREPIPPVVAQQKAEKQIRDIFNAEYDSLKKNPSDEVYRDLISKLRSHAENLDDDAVSRYVLLRQAGEIAQQAADVDTTLQIMGEISRLYEVNKYDLLAESMSECLSNTQLPKLCRNIAHQSILLSEDATQDDAFDGAIELLTVASSAALRAKDRRFARAITARRRDVLNLRKEFLSSKRAWETLQDDAESNCQMLCCEYGSKRRIPAGCRL